MGKRKKKDDETLVDIVEKKEQAQELYNDNQNLILGGLLLFVLLAGGIFAWNNFYKKPRQANAVNEMSQAQFQFDRDSFALALDNPGGGNPGFLDIIDEYSGTAAANLSHYYAGICYMNLGGAQNMDAAISYLSDFDDEGTVLASTKYGALGDCYSEKGDLGQAESYYKKAISNGDNEFLLAYYMKKLGLMYQSQGKMAEAKGMFEQIRDKYPFAPDGNGIEKYIMRVSGN